MLASYDHRSRTFPAVARFLSPLALVLAIASVAVAAETFKKGDAVEANVQDQWLPGKVEGVDRGGIVTVQLEVAGQSQKRPFKPAELRHAYESGGLTRARTWTDSTGKFRIKAALIAVGETEVTLRKPDMSEIKLAIEKLSAIDQKLIKDMAKDVAAKPAPKPEEAAVDLPLATGPAGEVETASAPEPVAFSTTGLAPADQSGKDRPALEPDPLAEPIKLVAGGAAFAARSPKDRFQAVFAVGGKEGWVLAAVDDGKDMAAKTRLLWCALADKKIAMEQALPVGEWAMDYHAPSHRLLSINHSSGGSKATLTVWEALPTEKVVKGIIRWEVDQNLGLSTGPWARLAASDVVLHADFGRIVAWDLAKQQARYQVACLGGNDRRPALSPGRKQLFVQGGGGGGAGARIYDTATGKHLATLANRAPATAIGVSDDGRRAAVADGADLTLWDLTDAAAKPTTLKVPPRAYQGQATLAFVSERVAVQLSNAVALHSTLHDAALWDYMLEGGVGVATGVRSHTIVDDHLVYGVPVTASQGKLLMIGSVKLPGPGVDDAEQNMKTVEPETYLEPGSPVQLVVNAGLHDEAVTAAVKKLLEKKGWKLVERANVVITATMTIGKQRVASFQRLGNPPEKVTIQEYRSTFEIKAKDYVAYERSAGNANVPQTIFLAPKETLQDWMDKRSGQPDPAFFEKLVVPDVIQDTRTPAAAGVSQVGSKGLVNQQK